MKRVCAWCQKPMKSDPDGGKPVSHGICDRCFESTVMKMTVRNGLHGVIDFPPAENVTRNLGNRRGSSPA